MKNFKNLKIWQQGMELVVGTYKLTKTFPNEEKFGLVSQMNRAAVSIPSNISEGSSRDSAKEYKYYIQIALGSCFELEIQLLIVERLKIGNQESLSKLKIMLDEEQKMLMGFMKKL